MTQDVWIFWAKKMTRINEEWPPIEGAILILFPQGHFQMAASAPAAEGKISNGRSDAVSLRCAGGVKGRSNEESAERLKQLPPSPAILFPPLPLPQYERNPRNPLPRFFKANFAAARIWDRMEEGILARDLGANWR